MLWGLMQQGSVCEVCNFVIHDRCLRYLVTPCTGVATSLIKNPVAHCWTSTLSPKRKFCNVCRKRWDNRNNTEWYCEICEYYAHADCVEFALANCKEIDVYVPGKQLSLVIYEHHWREGNLPSSAKCTICKKTCWSSECLSGYRCEWCGICCHPACKQYIPNECNFGALEPIFLPPHAVSVPRTEVPIEAIIGIKELEKKEPTLGTRSISDEISMVELSKCFDSEERELLQQSREKDKDKDKEKTEKYKEKEDRDEEVIKVYDGDLSYKRKIFRTITVSRLASVEHILNVTLEAFHIQRNPAAFYLTDLYSENEARLTDPSPVMNLFRKEGRRPAIYLRFKDRDNTIGEVRIYSGKLQMNKPYCNATVDDKTTVTDLIKKALFEFGLENAHFSNYRLCEVLLDRGVTERVLEQNEQPWKIMKQVGKESIYRMHLMRFYLQLKQDPHGTTIALFVGNLPKNFSERNYETFLTEILGKESKFSSIGPIYYEFGSLVITFDDSKKAVSAFYKLREEKFDNRPLLVMLLPNIEPSMIPANVKPLLVFVNVQSGGCQGLELITRFRKVLNPYQVFNLVNGGPLPGLYVFRHIQDYRILVCGGDGTVGWVLQCLDNVGQDSECSSPPCGIVPLGTGNDLSRVLRWGSGYNGNGNILSLLKGVIDAEEIRLDRWTVMLHPEDSQEPPPASSSAATTPASDENKSGVLVMNNYFGIGLDADLCLAFHNARKENPQKFQSRLGNKHMYFRMGLKKMLAPSGTSYEQLHRNMRLEVDNKLIELPELEGIIVLNILSWGSGANPWGHDKEDQFAAPNHYDGMLEVVGVGGVIHLGQIQSGLRSGIRIAQGGHIKIHLNIKTPIQIDGEPTRFGPGEIVILKSALKATMLKKNKSKHPPVPPALGTINGEENRKTIDES